MTPNDWEHALAVNLTAPYFLSCRLAERMLADAVVFHASDAARDITGQSIVVDGGWLTS